MTLKDYILEYFKDDPNRNIRPADAIDCAVKKYKAETGLDSADPESELNQLVDEGRIIKGMSGMYRYNTYYTENPHSQREYVLNYYINNPNKDIPHAEIVDAVTEQYKRETGKVLRDPDRFIRRLYQDGYLMKIGKGVYRYDPDLLADPNKEEFTPTQKEAIKKRYNYRCAICGLGPKDGVEIQVDHIIPRSRGGMATIENGQVLCSKHNFMKKNSDAYEMGKKMFIEFLTTAQKAGDEGTEEFCKDILAVYEKHHVDDHVKMDKNPDKDQ